MCEHPENDMVNDLDDGLAGLRGTGMGRTARRDVRLRFCHGDEWISLLVFRQDSPKDGPRASGHGGRSARGIWEC